MITLRTEKPLPDRDDVWCSELRLNSLTPARRDKLVSLLNLAGFVLRTGNADIKEGEIRNIDSILKIENGV